MEQAFGASVEVPFTVDKFRPAGKHYCQGHCNLLFMGFLTHWQENRITVAMKGNHIGAGIALLSRCRVLEQAIDCFPNLGILDGDRHMFFMCSLGGIIWFDESPS
jgi:hypothetical protein